jgi:DNA-binding NarL/FixJ family response regulator
MQRIDEEFAPGNTRVAVVDDHAMLAEGLAAGMAAEPDLTYVGCASTIAAAITLVEKEAPDVILMDYRLPDGDGVEATRELLKRWPHLKVVMLSGAGGPELVSRSIEAGCAGLIAKDRSARDVFSAVRAAARGESVLRTEDLALLLGRGKSSSGDNAAALTARELEVLKMLAKGLSTEAIAVELFVSIYTVRNHVGNILAKLGAHSKLEAVAAAARDGIISLTDIG